MFTLISSVTVDEDYMYLEVQEGHYSFEYRYDE